MRLTIRFDSIATPVATKIRPISVRVFDSIIVVDLWLLFIIISLLSNIVKYLRHNHV